MSDEKGTLKAVPIRRRSAARLAAIQIIYQSLITGQSAISFAQQFLVHYAGEVAKSFKVKSVDEAHLSVLCAGVEDDKKVIDSAIAAQLVNGWSLGRLTSVELSVLRCGTFELQSMLNIPAKVAVSEYAALGEAYGCDVGFVNAVLDQLARTARMVEMEKQR